MAQRLIKISVVYLAIGAIMGLYMGIGQDHTLVPVHVHILLAGWLSLAVVGIIYKLYPAAEATVLAKLHFWFHNIGLPAFMIGLAAELLRHPLPVFLPIGATVLLIGFLFLSINVLRNVRA